MYNVFLVDDEPFILSGLHDILDWDRLGLGIVGQAENGQEALAKLREVPADILITDISMPVMSGLELIREVRRFKPDVKVIVLSGYDEFTYVKEGLSLGIENYLLKPINLAEFESTLETVVEKIHTSRAKSEWSRYTAEVLKENVLLRWMRNQIDTDELMQRLKLLGLPEVQPWIQVAVISHENGVEWLRTAVEWQSGNAWGGYWFRDADNELVLIASFADKERGAAELAAMLEELGSKAPEDMHLRVALGSVCEAGHEPHRSYRQAKYALEFFAVDPGKQLIRYEELKDRTKALKESLPGDWSECSKLIMSKNGPGLADCVDLYFSPERTAGLTPESLPELALEWILFFRMLLKEIRSDEGADTIGTGLTAIRLAGSLPELAAAVKQTGTSLIELLEREVKSPVVNQVLKYIQTNYGEDLSLKQLGHAFNVHPVYLGQIFHKAVGESFAEYLNRFRIEKAKEQLRTTNNKVHEIAKSVGYWEMGYFYKQFRKYVSISPTEFKALL
ncbi:response regulator transcription factor [Paenibacillus sp. NFR01]|uniref:response regulator transcription factor n=1 Tax=Paenibacillus sp. NFR01 TaxID=1566279 RepID=UPI0008CB1EA4|nr:response regulator transcription factor [Paenibacillus sp. NFR01]SET10488.1 two-component system, response regulator YesN [Paenibacillus sp. NFR01]